MDILDFINKIYEFSEKGEEFSDEMKGFRATLNSLSISVANVGVDRIPPDLNQLLTSDMKESEELIEKASSSSKGWLTNVRNMLPGAPIEKIKEKNNTLLQRIQLLNLLLTAQNTKGITRTSTAQDDDDFEPTKMKKLHTFSEQNYPKESLNLQKKSTSVNANFSTAFEPTLLDEEDPQLKMLNGATQLDGEEEEPHNDIAFQLRLLYDREIGSLVAGKNDFVPILEKRWEGKTEVELSLQRVNFLQIPENSLKRISREHALIKAVRRSVVQNQSNTEDLAISATVPDDVYGATLNDAEDNGTGMEVEKTQYFLKNLSLNGTFYISEANLINFPRNGMIIKGDFQKLGKDEEYELKHGDIVALIAQKPHFKELQFGFQFLTN